MSMAASQGTLYLVATPIGNLADFSIRGADILSNVDIIACEDTRVTKKLLDHLSLRKPLLSYREENERIKSEELADSMVAGQSIALLSDAGYPGISDPGFRVVRECRRRGIDVCPIPGPNAAITALAASGLPTHQFLYLGFLPKKASAIKNLFLKWKDFEGSIVIYESKYRVSKTLLRVVEDLGEGRWVCISREITKLHETFYIDTAIKLYDKISTISSKGEFTIIIAPQGYTL
jgi:16S rRNA (cytidine1402-2'-O)-methyltransferase